MPILRSGLGFFERVGAEVGEEGIEVRSFAAGEGEEGLASLEISLKFGD